MTKLSTLVPAPNSSTQGPPCGAPISTPSSAEGAAAAKLTLLHLLARLLSLDAQRVLLHNPSRDSSEFLFTSYCSFLTYRTSTAADVQLRAEALQLLHHFLALPAGRLDQLSQHVEEMANNMFPASSWECKRGSTQSIDYARQLMALMDSMVAAAEQGLSVEPILQAILPVMREMGEQKGHVRQEALITRLTLVAAAPWKKLSARADPDADTLPSTPAKATQAQHAQHAPEASQQAQNLLEYAWKHVFTIPGLPSALRRAFLQFMLLPILRYSPLSFQQSVLQERAAALLAILNSSAGGGPNRLDEERELLARTAAYTLVQYVYEHMPAEEVKSVILGPAGGDQVNMRVLKAATNDVRGLVPTDTGLEEVAREARCAAFSCGAALVVATQEKENIFAILLKDPKSTDPAGPFNHLIQASQELNFSVEVDDSRRAAFKRTSTSVKAVAERIRADRKAAASLMATGTLGFAGSIGAFSSQGPSLSDKVSASQYSLGDALPSDSQAGFASSVDNVYQQSLSMDATQGMNDWQDDAAAAMLMDLPEDSLSVEDDELDRHDCMLPLIHLVEKAAALFQASHSGGSSGMPEWMKRMHAAVEGAQVDRAVRLFLVKVVVHVERRHAERGAAGQYAANSPSPASPQAATNEASQGVFGLFAADWFPVMISAVLGSAEEAAQQGVHYLLLDVCLTCLNWPSIFPALHRGGAPGLPAGVQLAADALMDYLVRAAYNPQRPVVNNNFNLIKAFVHHWRAAVPLPLPALLSLLGALPAKPSSGAPDARARRKAAEQRCVAMKLLAAGLVYGQAEPLMTNPDFKTAVKHVLDCVATKGGQTLAQQSGECMGVILAQHFRKSKAGLQMQSGRTAEQLEKEVKQVLLGIHGKGEHDRFIYTVERLTSFHGALIDSLRAPLLNALPQVTGMQQALLLDILQRRAAKLSGLMTDLRPVLPSLLASHNHALQNNLLQLLKVLLPAESDEAAGKLLQRLTQSFKDHSSSDCRRQHFEILRSAWQLRPAMHAVLRPALLSMLGDADPTLRAQALEFWNSALPKHVGLRLQALLQDSLTDAGLLRERLERQWTQSAAAMLLELPKGQRMYSAAIFDRELAECKFAEYPIDTYGKATLGMAPLFSSQWSSSQDSSQPQGMFRTAPGADPKSPGFGATQFTQAAAGMVLATQGATVGQSASLSLSMPRQDLASIGFSQGSSNSSGAGSSSSDTLSDRAVVRRRFNRSAGRTTEILGRLQRRRAAAGAQAIARERKVNLMRKYRTGELPDVQQLSIAAFLAPLGVMASRDANIAQITVEAVWRGVCLADHKGETPLDLLQGLRLALSQCFEQQPRQAGYVQCLQSLALADRGGYVSVKPAADAAQVSGRLQAGALQIEEQMLFGAEPEASEPKSKRRAVGNRTQGSSTGGSHPMEPSRRADAPSWGALAEVYAQLGQDDLVQVIYAKCLSRCPGSEVAMQALTQRKVDFAFRVYQALLGGIAGGGEAEAMDIDTQAAEQGLDVAKLMGGAQPLKEEEDMWFRQQNRCMESLGMWEDVLSIVDDETGNDEGRLFVQEDNWDGSQYLRPFVRACLFQPMERHRLGQLIQKAATNSRMSSMLESTTAVEVAAQAAISQQWDRCQALISRGWGVFREKWGGLHPLSRARRLQTLASLQPLAEMQAVVSLLAGLSAGAVDVEGLQSLVEGWCQRWSSVQQPSTDACLTVIHVRGLLLDALMQVWPRELQHGGRTLFQVLQGFQGDVLLGGAACLARQGFLDTAQDLLTQHRAAVGKAHLPSLQAQLRLRIAQVDANPTTEYLYKDLSGELKQLDQMQSDDKSLAKSMSASLRCELLLLQAQAHQRLSRQPGNTNRSEELSAALQLYQQAAAVKLDTTQQAAAVKLGGWQQQAEGEGCQSAQAVAEASLKLALLCNDLLQDGSAAAGVRTQQGGLDAMLVWHMMQAMRLGGRSGQEAQLYVPRILSVLDSSKEAQQCFTEVWSRVALHVLLPWAAQMLSLLEAPQGAALLPALQALAEHFPQQLYFPFKLSKGHYGPDGQGRASSLQPLLNSPLMEEWGAALNETTYPAQRWEGWMGRLSSLVAAGQKAAAQTLYKDEVYPDMITNHLRGGRAARGPSGSTGPPATVNSAFAAKWDSKFKDTFGGAGEKIARVSARDFEGQCARLAQGIKQETDQVTGKRDLARLSSWFESFTQRAGTAEEEHQLVMPQMPNVHSSQGGLPPNHVVGFGKIVDVFSSKQRPKKLTIYGDDFRKYDWIVKGGEEVRIDQRIEQLFDVMNGLMQRQPGAAAHSLQVRTYDVVPISPSLGMVAFVPGTRPLKALLTDPALVLPEAVAAADNRYSTFILTKGGNLERAGPRYERMFRSASRKETVANLEAVQSHIRWDSLREALIRAAGGPELFLSMRAAYTASLAAVSMTGYVAGVGDRHTDNFLMDLSSGTLVPIDFGYSFGTAVQVLPIPELMPFRLTRQMTGALQPHDALALLQTPCTLAMTALRSGKDVLEGIMGVFMREPLLDWQREARVVNAKRSAAGSAKDPVSAADTIDPQDMHINLKVDNALQKLSGKHPADIMLLELTAKHANGAHWKALQAIVKGDDSHNVRTKAAGDNLSVEDQVRCLLDQATDPNILGRTWQGWKPYL